MTYYGTPSGRYRVGSGGPVPYPESLIWGEFMRPVDIWEKAPPPKFRDIKRSSVPLKCLDVLIPDMSIASSYCVAAPQLLLRAMESDNYSTVYNDPAVFQHRFVARQISLRDGKEQVLDLNVDELRGMRAADVPELRRPVDAAKTDPIPTGPGVWMAHEAVDAGAEIQHVC